MPWRDIAVATVMLVIAVVAFRESWNMPIFGGQRLTAPGLFPMITAAAIGLLALTVLIRRIPEVLGWRPMRPEAPEEEIGSVTKVIICTLITAGAVALMRPAGFIVAGMFATAGLMLTGLGRRPNLPEGAVILGTALILPFVMHWVFTQIFLTPLP
ncbi:MAG: tripartite tricarboxylate transporter TctB family protein [Roseomonas sp.]|nr:tripartite tricarboxylate transporter TctB family protein [Roseomonas sp.]